MNRQGPSDIFNYVEYNRCDTNSTTGGAIVCFFCEIWYLKAIEKQIFVHGLNIHKLQRVWSFLMSWGPSVSEAQIGNRVITSLYCLRFSGVWLVKIWRKKKRFYILQWPNILFTPSLYALAQRSLKAYVLKIYCNTVESSSPLPFFCT